MAGLAELPFLSISVRPGRRRPVKRDAGNKPVRPQSLLEENEPHRGIGKLLAAYGQFGQSLAFLDTQSL